MDLGFTSVMIKDWQNAFIVREKVNNQQDNRGKKNERKTHV